MDWNSSFSGRQSWREGRKFRVGAEKLVMVVTRAYAGPHTNITSIYFPQKVWQPLQDCSLSRFLPFIPSSIDVKYPAGAPPLLAFTLPALDSLPLVACDRVPETSSGPCFLVTPVILGNRSASRSLFHIREFRKPDIGLGVEYYLNKRSRPLQAVITFLPQARRYQRGIPFFSEIPGYLRFRRCFAWRTLCCE